MYLSIFMGEKAQRNKSGTQHVDFCAHRSLPPCGGVPRKSTLTSATWSATAAQSVLGQNAEGRRRLLAARKLRALRSDACSTKGSHMHVVVELEEPRQHAPPIWFQQTTLRNSIEK